MHGGLSDLLIRSNRLQQAVVAPDMGYTQRFDHIACNRFQRQRGAYAVEFALVFPLFFLIVYATLTYGLIFTAQQSLNYAAESGPGAPLPWPPPSAPKGRPHAALPAAEDFSAGSHTLAVGPRLAIGCG